MNIRSITGFVTLADPLPPTALAALGELVSAARQEFPRAGLPIQTTRVGAQPLASIAPRDLVQFARALDAAIRENGVDYAALGALPGDHPLAEAIPAAIAATDNVFASTVIASADGIHLPSVRATGRVMRGIADRRPDGTGNFRFAALANCGPFTPFFPTAYHGGPERAFAVAAEGAPLAVQALSAAPSLDAARTEFVHAIEETNARITRVANNLAARFSFRFAGIDFSLAPAPGEAQSIGTAIERLTGVPFGDHGTLFGAAFVTDCIHRAHFPRAGFSGLMLPVFEDSTLAARASNYSIDSLLLYSTVCGTGLDTIPLPGDTRAEALAAILLDVATLAVKLNKPLTARLIPIAGLQVGDTTHFDSPYMTNAPVLDPHARPVRVFDGAVGFVGRGK